MRLPDDFWSVNEDEPGLASLIAGAFVFGLLVASVFAWLVVGAAAQ